MVRYPNHVEPELTVGDRPDRASFVRAARTLAMASRALERSLEDMTLPQYRVLSIIASSPERAGRVAQRAALSRPSLTGILDGLVARGWVQRCEVSGDRRGVHLEVTPSGRTQLGSADAAMSDNLRALLGGADPGATATFMAGVAVLQAALSAGYERTAP
jgi:DNA-binding MarR family transcriptional regulator